MKIGNKITSCFKGVGLHGCSYLKIYSERGNSIPGVDPVPPLIPLIFNFQIQDLGKRDGKLGAAYYSEDHLSLTFEVGESAWVTLFGMGLEPGGYADKKGNQYERHWIVKQFLRLLDEDIRSVTIEPLGEDEQGVDLWIEKKDGRREAQQCKARNAQKENWSIQDLKNRGILSKMQVQRR